MEDAHAPTDAEAADLGRPDEAAPPDVTEAFDPDAPTSPEPAAATGATGAVIAYDTYLTVCGCVVRSGDEAFALADDLIAASRNVWGTHNGTYVEGRSTAHRLALGLD